MAEEVKQEKKKVYVETTVVSDAIALPARDIVQLGRQVVTREWWATAAQRFDLFSSPVVAKEIRRGDPEAAMRVLTSAHRRCFRKEAVNEAGKTI